MFRYVLACRGQHITQRLTRPHLLSESVTFKLFQMCGVALAYDDKIYI